MASPSSSSNASAAKKKRMPVVSPPGGNKPTAAKKRAKREQQQQEWGAEADELKQCFLWELAQAFKEHYIFSEKFNSRNKLTYARDYSEMIPVSELRDLAWAQFAPPIQRLCAVLALRLAPLPCDVASLVVGHLFPGFGSLDEVCAAYRDYFLGPPECAAGKLTVRLPKNYKRVSKDPLVRRLMDYGHANAASLPRGVGSSYCWLHEVITTHWWLSKNDKTCLVGRILTAESLVTGPSQVTRALGLPVVPEPTEPHSLELMFKLKRPGDSSSSVFATMVVPHDLRVTSLFTWVQQHLDPEDFFDLSSYTYLHIVDRHKEYSYMLETNHRNVSGGPSVELSEILPHSLTVRVWAIGDDYTTGFTCNALGSRADVVKKATDWADENRGSDCGDFENNSYLCKEEHGHYTSVDVMFDCAVADVLPLPEERWPSLQSYLENELKFVHSVDAKMEWNHSRHEFECFALRRLPRLPDEVYPVVKRVSSMPNNHL